MEQISKNSLKILDHYVRKKLKQEHKEIWIKITGDCMNPWIVHGDNVRILPQPQYFVGDIVVCCYSDRFFAHRIVHIHRDKIITKGDNADVLDAKITNTKIMGIIVAKKNCFDNEPHVLDTKSIFIKVGAYFSYISGKAMSKHLRTNVLIYKKTLLYLHNLTKRISIKIFKKAYEKTKSHSRKTPV